MGDKNAIVLATRHWRSLWNRAAMAYLRSDPHRGEVMPLPQVPGPALKRMMSAEAPCHQRSSVWYSNGLTEQLMPDVLFFFFYFLSLLGTLQLVGEWKTKYSIPEADHELPEASCSSSVAPVHQNQHHLGAWAQPHPLLWAWHSG